VATGASGGGGGGRKAHPAQSAKFTDFEADCGGVTGNVRDSSLLRSSVFHTPPLAEQQIPPPPYREGADAHDSSKSGAGGPHQRRWRAAPAALEGHSSGVEWPLQRRWSAVAAPLQWRCSAAPAPLGQVYMYFNMLLVIFPVDGMRVRTKTGSF